VPDGRIDLWSVASHEFGHAAGWTGRHYGKDEDPERSSICNSGNVNRQTMCSIIYTGSESVRTLGRHDRHTFRRVYAARP
jgi:hypothetical protein